MMWVFKAPHEVTSRVGSQRVGEADAEAAPTTARVHGILTCLETGAVITVKPSSRGFRVQSHYLGCADGANLSSVFADNEKAEAALQNLACKMGAIVFDEPGMPVVGAAVGE